MASESVPLDEVPCPLLVVGSGLIYGATPAAARLLARPADELVGLRIGDLVRAEDQERLDAALGSAVLASAARRSNVVPTVAPTDARTEGGPPRPDGAEAVVHLGGRPVGIRATASADGRILVALRDLAGERRLSAILDAVADSTLLLDRDGRLLWQSAGLEAGLLAGSEGLGSHPLDRLHPEDLPLILEAFAELALEPGSRLNRIVRSRSVADDTAWQFIEVVAASRLEDPDLGGVVVAVRNIDAGDAPESVAHTEEPLLSMADVALLQMLDATSDFVAIFRPSGEILHTNAALAQILAESAAAGGSGRLGDLLDDREGFINRGLAVIATADTWHGELTLRIAPGRALAVSALGVVGRDEDGEADWVAMVARDISDLKEAESRLRRLATSDHLTGLPNRALFTEQLDEVVAGASRTGRSVAVLFCDLDRFKEVNDQHGHAAGDAVLVEIADRLCTIVRGEDLVARVGGDEFVVLCDGADDPEDLAALADRVIQVVRQPIEVGDTQVQVGISIGVALSRSGQGSGDRVLIAADQAMYRAKATGGSRYRIVELGPAPNAES